MHLLVELFRCLHDINIELLITNHTTLTTYATENVFNGLVFNFKLFLLKANYTYGKLIK